jgi:hydrogenase nickel incorporation protein HypA/HybF
MHELSITREILRIVCEAARDRRIYTVTLEIGTLSCVSPEAVEFCFNVAAQGTPAEGARLDIRRTEGEECNVAKMELEEIA